MPEDVLIPGVRDVRGTLSASASIADADVGAGADGGACVIACPPHPQHGGSRSDGRLRAVADALAERGVACLRFDYGPWDEGRGERTDAAYALAWARERYDRVGLFGYSFGAAVALVVAVSVAAADGEAVTASAGGPLCAVSVLAPPARIAQLDASAAVDGVEAPLQVSYGERDDTVDWEPVVDAAREAGATICAFSGDHFFFGAEQRVGETVAGFLAERC